MAKGYLDIGGGYSYAALRVGLVLRNPAGREVYFQPGDDEAAARDSIDALDEISDDVTDAKRGAVADIAFSEYFA